MAGEEGTAEPTATHPLLRDAAAGMNPVTLLTGFYGARGERIKHRVHAGALQLPAAALEIFAAGELSTSKKEDGTYKPEEYSLPGLDSVVRPSVDPALPQFTVTEVRKEDFSEEIVSPEDGSVQTKTYSKMVAKNRVIIREVRGAERIRGGGEEETANAIQNPSPSLEAAQPNEPAAEASSLGLAVAPAVASVTTASPMETEIEAETASAAPTAPTEAAPPEAAQPEAAPSEAAQPEDVPSEAAQPEAAPVEAVQVEAVRPKAAQPSNTLEVGIPATSIAENASTAPAPTPAAQPISVVSAVATVQPSTSTSAPPPLVSSSVQAPDQDQEPQVIPLKKRPASQWEQHKLGPNDEMMVDEASKTPKPDWYKTDIASSLERAVLPEWFDGSAAHRTPETFLQAREKIIDMSVKLGLNRYITCTMVRRAIPGDAGSLLRLHAFLTSYALINEEAINESAPTPIVFLKKYVSWHDDSLRENLMQAVVEQARKRPKVMAASDFVPIDWAAVAASVGHGTTPSDCERQFLAMPIDAREGSITPDASMGDDCHEAAQNDAKAAIQQELLTDLVDGADPAVISAVTKAALCSTDSLSQARRAGAVGLVAHRALMEARSQEDAVARILAEIVDLRMKKLENRLALLDDVEGILEAERAALELERRDLYTARCRHWFGGT